MVMTLNSLLRKVSEQLISVLGVYFRLQSFVFMPIFGMTQGLMPIMAYNYGAKNRARLMGALRIGILVSLLIMTGGFFLFQTQADALLFLFNATPLMMEMGVPALRIISLAFWFAGVNICLSTFFQALGLGKHSLLLSLSRQYVFIVPLVAIFRFISIPLTWLSFLIVETISLVVAYILFRRVRADYL
jgi:Na+-driven multidrug efflux pump